MKIKKLIFCLITSIMTIFAVGFVAYSGNNEVAGFSRIQKAINNPYELEIEPLINKNINFTQATSNGNLVYFYFYKCVGSNDFWGTINNGGRFINVSAITGIEYVRINTIGVNSTLTISYGWEYDHYVNGDSIDFNENQTYSFNDENPSFFMIKNDSGADVNIASISICYSCSESIEPIKYGQLHYGTVGDNSYFVAGYEPGIEKAIISPYFNGYPVTTISSCFGGCKTLKEIYIPSTITTIHTYAFSGCTSLEAIYLPDSVVSLGGAAFVGCTGLKQVHLSNSILAIEGETFRNCSSLEEITFPSSLESIGHLAFYNCSSLCSISIPNSVKIIGYSAFENCTTLESINIPTALETLGDSSFTNCEKLCSEIVIPNTLISFGNYSFYNCTSLTDVIINDGVCEIGSSAFCMCSSLMNVRIPNTLKKVSGSFSGCYKLNANISNNGRYLGNEQNPYVYLYEVVDKFSSNFEIRSECRVVDNGTFTECYFSSLTIPSGVIFLGGLRSCRCLDSILIPSTVEYLCGISDCDLINSIHIPASVLELGRSPFIDNEGLLEIEVDDTNPNYSSIDGVLFNKTKTKIISYPSGKKDTSYTIPNTVVLIDDYAFYRCYYLEFVDIPYGVTTIGENAFGICYSLNSIVIPNTVTSIGSRAFENCQALSSIIIEENVTSIGYYTFMGCTATIYCKAESKQSGWSNYWDYGFDGEVVWGYKGE